MPHQAKNIFILTNNHPFSFDGVADYSYNLMKMLGREGYTVKIICKKNKSRFIQDSLKDHLIASVNNWGIRDLFSISNYLKRESADWVLIQYVPYAFNKQGVPFALLFYISIFRLLGIKVQVNFHEIAVRFYGNGIIGFMRAFLQRAIAYMIYISANKSQTSNIYYSKLLYPFAVDVFAIPSNFEIEISALEEIDRPTINSFNIIVNANRCYSPIFEALSILKTISSKKICLIIVGRADQSDISRIHNFISQWYLSDSIKLMFNLSSTELIQAMAISHAFIQAEYVDQFGGGGVSSKSGTTSTALQLGLPIIATKGDMTDADLFQEDKNIVFLSTYTADQLARKINELINNELYRQSIRKCAKESYDIHFQWKWTLNYLKQIIASK